MRVRTDDEVYRVDAVWLGPPKATFPWRARYVAWGVGIVVFLVVLTIERQMGVGFGFFSTAWALVATIILTRFITARISHERPLTAVMSMWARIRVSPQRPRPKLSKKQRARQQAQHRRTSASRKKEVRGVRTPARP